MKLLLTGGSGFLGRTVDKYLREKYKSPDHSIMKMVRRYSQGGLFDFITDIKHSTEVKWMLDEYKPDVIIHLAAVASGKPDDKNPLGIFEDNVLGTLNLLEHAPKGCHFINASSITVYGDNLGVDEIDAPQPTSLYSLSKTMSEEAVKRYDRLGKINGLNLRLCALVGPPQTLTHGFIKDLILKIQSKDETLNLIGNNPGAKKPFLNIKDACRVIHHAIEKILVGTYNICPDDNISVKEVANLAMDHYHIYKEIVWENKAWEGDNLEILAYNDDLYKSDFKLEYESSREAIRAALNEF